MPVKSDIRAARARDQELVEIKPIILGGDPSDQKNKKWLSRQQHIEYVTCWNRIVRSLKGRSEG
jgi:hypothetical protein